MKHGNIVGQTMLLLICLGLMLSQWGTVASADSALPEKGDPYTLRFMPEEAAAHGLPYLCRSPFGVRASVSGVGHGDEIFPRIVNLVEASSGEGQASYRSIPAFSADAAADMVPNTRYRRINLEDSGYFSRQDAMRIRAVVQNAFPRKTEAAVQLQANAWLERQGLAQIQQLQSGEVILAAQSAIWKIAHGEDFVIQSFYSGSMADAGDGELAKVIDAAMQRQTPTSHTPQNVASLYAYFSSLEGEGKRCDVLSEKSFSDPSYTWEREADGSYTIRAAVRVTTAVTREDSLWISADCAGQTQSQALTAAGECRFTFRGVPELSKVCVEAWGEQSGWDVFLFDAEGEQEASETLTGYDGGTFPVYGQIVITP